MTRKKFTVDWLLCSNSVLDTRAVSSMYMHDYNENNSASLARSRTSRLSTLPVESVADSATGAPSGIVAAHILVNQLWAGLVVCRV